jgi:hypothetical protein
VRHVRMQAPLNATDEGAFTFPWPGPGNSEGPVDPEGWVNVAAGKVLMEHPSPASAQLVSTSPWPGPGDSE